MNALGRTWTLGAAAVAAAIAAAPAPTLGAPERDLVVVSWGGDYTRSQMLAFVKPYRAHSDEWVTMETYDGSLGGIREQVATENVIWDVVDMEQSAAIQACEEGLLESIDHGILDAGADGSAPADDFLAGSLTDCGIALTVWSTVVAYDTDAVGRSAPESIADFFDVRAFPGKRGLRRDPQVILEWALIADGVSPDDVYEELGSDDGVDRAFEQLDNLRNQIVWWTGGAEPIEMLAADEVVMTSAWNGRTHRPIQAGDPIAVLWDGQVWTIDSWTIPKGSDNVEKALDFIRFATGSEQMAEMSKHISYGPPRRSSLAFVPEEAQSSLPTAPANLGNALRIDAEWWAANKAEMSARFEEWIVGGGRGPLGTAR